MTPEQILAHPARVLTEAQREHYFDHGFVSVERLVPETTLDELRTVTEHFFNQSRRITASDDVFDVAPGHSAEKPILRRLKSPDERHEVYWGFATGLMADVAADLVGPNVVFHHSKLNFKWYEESDTVKWHQDIQFFPHTNYNVITIGCYLADTDMNNGPLAALRGSHNEDLYDQYDAGGTWTGMLSDDDAAGVDMSRVAYMTGPAGSITIHNARTLHYSPSSKSPVPRPLLLNCYTAADAKPYTAHPQPTRNSYKVIRGEQVRWAHHDPRPCQIPPDWSGGYTSIYAAQSGEDHGGGDQGTTETM
ncbi:MAG: phytanoyl-CoA dioxygenase family protein [Pseudomonadota bacterium]